MEEKWIDEFIDSYQTTYVFAIKEISDRVRKHDREVSIEQFFLLRELTRQDALSATEIACMMNVNKSAMTTKIKRLEEKNWITREKNSADRREILIKITQAGKDFTLKCEQDMKGLILDWVAILGEEESTEFLRLYQLITQTVVAKKRGEA
ncbi:MarR family winged helix-turn-helix transcriptional regulator [Listeria ilorinensis]|uniref:MarR family winged helix-turn-helix transcriptional regulator n=1 Tax=Listeria ilorinensis TaxID=2867439 RepID=UPI001EF677FC|nr:MarR family transcriptional regulator [Listeria ilorinensis]